MRPLRNVLSLTSVVSKESDSYLLSNHLLSAVIIIDGLAKRRAEKTPASTPGTLLRARRRDFNAVIQEIGIANSKVRFNRACSFIAVRHKPTA